MRTRCRKHHNGETRTKTRGNVREHVKWRTPHLLVRKLSRASARDPDHLESEVLLVHLIHGLGGEKGRGDDGGDGWREGIVRVRREIEREEKTCALTCAAQLLVKALQRGAPS